MTGEYIRYLRPVNETEEEKYKKKYSEKTTKIPVETFRKRVDQYDYLDFIKLCNEEKLLDTNKIDYDNKPLISIVLPTYYKENELYLVMCVILLHLYHP